MSVALYHRAGCADYNRRMSQTILLRSVLRTLEASHRDVQPPLMERAGAAAGALALSMLADTADSVRRQRVLILAGPGNNGGDAFVVARLLKAAAIPVTLACLVDAATAMPADASAARAAWLAADGRIADDWLDDDDYRLVIDGLFGSGLNRPPDARAAAWIERLNRHAWPVLSLDLPSGLDADSGRVHRLAVRATRTISFIAPPPGLFTADGPDHAGVIDCCALGLMPDVDETMPPDGGKTISPALFAAALQPRRHNSHKGSFGSVAIVGGAAGMSGAALLAARAALRLGAGRVMACLLEPLAVDCEQPELMLRPSKDARDTLTTASVCAIGPGLGLSLLAGELLLAALDSNQPLVLDADALTLLGQGALLLRKLAVRPAPTFLTPHPAEAARLLDIDVPTIQANRIGYACTLARRCNAYVILKGCGSIVAAPDGRWFVNTNGNPGLATAGSGDVLAGLLAALLAQGWSPLAAALAAPHLHGAAADRCVSNGLGPIGLTAGELIDAARQVLNRWVTGYNRSDRTLAPPI